LRSLEHDNSRFPSFFSIAYNAIEIGDREMISAKAVSILIVVIFLGSIFGYYGYVYATNLPKYADAIVHGTVQSVYQGADPRPGFSRPLAWFYNVTLDKGTHGNMTVWEDCANQTNSCPDSYPVKENGVWVYRVIVDCNFYKVGDSVYLRVPIYQGGNIWSEPKAVQGYNYNNVSPHTYDYPAFYGPAGSGYFPIEGC
jgi:hypothetical protein